MVLQLKSVPLVYKSLNSPWPSELDLLCIAFIWKVNLVICLPDSLITIEREKKNTLQDSKSE